MPCEELEKLRKDIRQLQAQMKELRRTSQAASTSDRRDATRHVGTTEHLQRRIARVATAIEQHVAKHGCTASE